MELKHLRLLLKTSKMKCLNRTFYGIETCWAAAKREKKNCRLNRTFYGIETKLKKICYTHISVLIVPFMELKH